MNAAPAVRVLAVCGSLRRRSSNRSLLGAAARVAPAGVEIATYEGLQQLPPFSPDDDADGAPASVADFRAALQNCDAVLISSPEYAHGVPGALKNALDWVVGSGEFIDKPVAIVNASSRATHAWNSLYETLTTMSARVIREASITLPLDGNTPDVDAVASDPRLSYPLAAAIEHLANATRGGSRPSADAIVLARPEDLGRVPNIGDVVVSDHAAPEDLAFLEDQINEHNFATTGIRDARLLVIALRDRAGRIYAGLSGHTWGGVAEVRFLWVDEAKRRLGLGTRLLGAAEREARLRGCRKVVLSTHSFQAPDFYARLGYRAAGAFSDYPAGHASIFFEKTLV